tara:strand:- start:5256 stop:5768 length:513 start_codon:yes stop_codon:yes gene_type:complete
MAGAALAAAVALSVVSSIRAGNAAKNQADAENQLLERQAVNVEAKNKLDVADLKRTNSFRRSAIKASEGASGLQIGSGSSLLAAEDFETRADANQERLRLGGVQEATRLRSQGALIKAKGKNAKSASLFRAGGSILKGAASFGGGFGGGSTASSGLTSSQSSNLSKAYPN